MKCRELGLALKEHYKQNRICLNEIRTVKKVERSVEICKTMLAFDIDHTLSLSKQPISKEVAGLLIQLMGKFEVCIISGRSFDQFMTQVIGRLPIPDAELFSHLHCLPAQGTQYYRFTDTGWEKVYAHYLREEEVSRIFTVVKQSARELGFWRKENREVGDTILENRQSQVTFAAVDTSAETEVKRAWDPDCAKRLAIIKRCKELAPEFEYKIGGNTSIDITLPGMDKGFGMRRLLEELEMEKEEILYFGDMTEPGGNDYPIVQMGIDTITVKEYFDTIFAMKAILGILG